MNAIPSSPTCCPTWARPLAEAVLDLLAREDAGSLEALSGLYHLSSEGVASWFEFAEFIREQAEPAARAPLEAIDTDSNVSVPSLEVPATADDVGDDRFTALAIAVPSTTDGNMGPSDADWFELTLNGGQDYTFTVLNNGLTNGGVRLYTASGTTLLASDDGPASGSTLAEINYTPSFNDTFYVEVVGNGAVEPLPGLGLVHPPARHQEAARRARRSRRRSSSINPTPTEMALSATLKVCQW